MINLYLISESDSLKSCIIMENCLEELTSKYKAHLVTINEPGRNIALAERYNIDVLYLDDRFDIRFIERNNIDVNESIFVLLGWPYIINDETVERLDGKLVNCHGSYLPDYKGSRAYLHYWANIEEYYGATIHYVSSKVDEGNVLNKKKVKLFSEETPEIIHRRIAEISAFLLPDSIQKVTKSDPGECQKQSGRYFYKMDNNEMLEIRKHNENNPMKRILTKHKVSQK